MAKNHMEPFLPILDEGWAVKRILVLIMKIILIVVLVILMLAR